MPYINRNVYHKSIYLGDFFLFTNLQTKTSDKLRELFISLPLAGIPIVPDAVNDFDEAFGIP